MLSGTGAEKNAPSTSGKSAAKAARRKRNSRTGHHHTAEPLESRLMLAAGPVVESINRASPGSTVTSSPTVRYLVRFSEPVTGVDPSDFSLTLTGSVTATTPVSVVGGGDIYAVTVSNVSGTGSLTLNLVDDGTIKDAAGNPLQPIPGSFLPQHTFAVGSGPDSIAVGDLNGDGKPDLAVANGASNSISILLGNGNGTFLPQSTFATALRPTLVMIADGNADGKPDLAVIENEVVIFAGNGDGSFRFTISSPAFMWPLQISTATGTLITWRPNRLTPLSTWEMVTERSGLLERSPPAARPWRRPTSMAMERPT